MGTAASLIKRSLGSIGAIASGETPSAAEQADALEILNDILESWSNDGFMLYEEAVEEFDLIGGQSVYTIGTGAGLDTARPQNILAAKVRSVNGGERSIDVINSQQWFSGIRQSITTPSLPQGLNYEPNFPNGTITLSPPPENGSKLILRSLKSLTAIPTAATEISYPPGYKKALKDCLKIELAEEFGRPVTQTMVDSAKQSKLGIQRANTRSVVMTSDAIGVTGCNNFSRDTLE